jgi:hypothetical protein
VDAICTDDYFGGTTLFLLPFRPSPWQTPDGLVWMEIRPDKMAADQFFIKRTIKIYPGLFSGNLPSGKMTIVSMV